MKHQHQLEAIVNGTPVLVRAASHDGVEVIVSGEYWIPTTSLDSLHAELAEARKQLAAAREQITPRDGAGRGALSRLEERTWQRARLHGEGVRMTTKLQRYRKRRDELDAERNRLNVLVRELDDMISEEVAKAPLRCSGCDNTPDRSEVHVMQEMYYEEPYGCTGGDTWWDKGQPFWICECDTVNFITKLDGCPKPRKVQRVRRLGCPDEFRYI